MWSLLALSLVPVVVYTTYVYFNDRYDKEPLRMLIAAFLLGVLSVIPALIFSGFLSGIFPDNHATLTGSFLYAFITVALSEEMAKFLMMRLFLYRRKAFDEPYDGIMYTMMVGMGFAALENLLYVFGQPSFAESVYVGGWRAVTAIPAHATFAILMGYYAGKAKFAEGGGGLWLLIGVLAATLFHGAYDFFLMQQVIPGIVLGAFASLIVGAVLSVRAMRYHQRNSPHASL